MTFYKVLETDGRAHHGGVGAWALPANGEPGSWMPPVSGPLVACENGYHLCRPKDLVVWLGPMIWEAEPGAEQVEAEDKIVVRTARLLRRCARWTDRTARLFAADCAERALPHWQRKYPNDDRPGIAIERARQFANGTIRSMELTAAWDAAAWDAARAARADAGAAAWAARAAARAAGDVACAAARDAARAAACAAARAAARAAGDAAGAAERQWQTTRLFDYLDGRAP